jgi:hypothetical protein
MAITKEINVVVKETGLDTVQKQVNKLDSSLENLSDTQAGLVKSMQNSSNSVLENGGAMGLLNDATGGLAMTVKDAVEASVLFTKSQKVAAITQGIYTTVVGTSTGAMKLFRLALVATGIGAIVVGIGLLIANFDKVKKVVTNLIPGLAQVGEFIGGIVESVTDFIGVTSEAERALADLTAQADKSLAMNKKFMQEEGDLVNKYTKAKIDAKNAYNEAIKEEGANQKKLAERLNRELLAVDKMHEEDLAKNRKEAQDKIDEANKIARDKRKADRQKEIDDQKKIDEDLAKSKLDADMKSAQDAITIIDELNKNIETPSQKLQREFEEKKAVLEANNLSTQELEVQHIDAMFAISEEARLKKEEIRKADEEKTKESQQKFYDELIAQEENLKNAKIGAVNFTTQLIAQLAGKNKAVAIAMLAVEKGLAIAQIVSSAGKSIATATGNLASVPAVIGVLPNPMYAVQAAATIKGIAATKISAATSIASILAQSITSAKGIISGGGDSGSSVSTATPSAPSFNLVQGTASNQIASSIGKQQPIEAFVVGRNVTSSQELDRNIVKSASL